MALSPSSSCLAAQDCCLEQALLTSDPRQIPLSWRDAQRLLQALRGHGLKLDEWKGAVPEVDEWWTGDASSPIVLLQNDQDEVERNPIYNSKTLFGVTSSCLLLESRDMLPTHCIQNMPYHSKSYSRDGILILYCISPRQNLRG